MIPNPKKIAVKDKAQEQYLTVLAASALYPGRHGRLKNEIKKKWVTEKIDILPRNLVELLKATEGFVDDKTTQNKPRYDSNEACVALVDAGERKQRGG